MTEWYGYLPEGWQISRLKYLVNQTADHAESNTGYIGLENIESWSGKYQKKGDSSFEAEGVSLKVRKGDIIFGKLRPYLAKCYLAEKDACCSTEFIVMTPNKINPVFLKYLLLSPKFIDEINMSTYGSKMPRANWDFIGNTFVPLPIFEEQKIIADYVDNKVEEINNLIEEAKVSIEEYKAWKASIIYETVTKGLDKDVEMKDSGFEWIGCMPAHWRLIQNKHVMRKQKRICDSYKGQDIISLTMNGVIIRDLGAGGKMPTTFDGYQYVYPGELLMCLFDIDVTPRCVGRVYNEGLTSPAYSCFVLNGGMNLDYYYYYYLMMDNTKELLHLAKNLRHSLTEEQLGQIKVPVPPIEEQIEIGKVLDDKTKMIDSLISEKESLIIDLEAYKKSLIFEVVTGKRKVV